MTPEELKARGAFYAALSEVPRNTTLADAMAAANRHGFAWWSQQAGVTLGHSAGHEVSAESLELLLGPYDPQLVSLPEVDAPEWVTDRLPTEEDADDLGWVQTYCSSGRETWDRYDLVTPGMRWLPAPPGHE